MRSIVVAVIVAAALAGCSSTTPTTAVPATPTASHSVPPVTPTATPTLTKFWSTCTDEAGDGQSGADIAKVDLHNDGKLIFVTFTLAEQVQPSDFGQISLLTTAYSADGEHGYQFGSKFSSGTEVANFVFDLDGASQKNITNGAIFADGVISMRYPVADLAALGGDFTWYASVSVDTLDADLCGGPLEEAIPVG